MTTPLSPLDIWQRGHVDPLRFKPHLLQARLTEVIAWCDSLQNLSDFRSEQLKPRLLHDGPDDLVCDIGHSRYHQLHYRKLSIAQGRPMVSTGKFLLYFPDEDLCDGAAEVASSGFFDVFNLPAYDTWVSFFVEEDRTRKYPRRYLLCYIPRFMLAAAEAGVEVNPEQCIEWLHNSHVSIRPLVESMVKTC
jgi:hypothetical protein